MSFLGIDLGTSGLRALLVDAEGRPLASAEHGCTAAHPRPGWSEQDPAQWIAALDAVMVDLRDAAPDFAGLRGIAVAGHMHGATLLGADDNVLRPCILWNDSRSHEEAAALDADPAFREISGNIVFPGFTAPKLDWLRRHEPDIFAAIAKVLLPAGYLNLHLTGDHVADLSDSSGTSWLDVGRRDWSDRLLGACGLSQAQMPRLVEGAAPAGILRPALAQRWGVGRDVVVAGGAGDNAAAACGMGSLAEGQGFVSLGTSGVLLAARGSYRPAPGTAVHTFCHAVPERWYQMGVMLSATDSLNWLADITGAPPRVLTAALGDRPVAPGGARFLPYLSGERTPHNNSAIRAAFTGIGRDTTRDDLTRAVLEGVCFGLRQSHEALTATGARFDRLFAIGGGTASAYWCALLATVLKTPLHLPEGQEFGAAMGAARLARVAATGSAVEAIMTPPPDGRVIEPVAALTDAFDAAYARFGAAYPAIRAIQ